MQGREIKFRAWYETGKRMIDWDEMKDDDELPYILENKLSDVSPAMQFTGLYDKNGKEIYEGDVGTKDGVLYQVTWVERGAMYGVKVIKTDHVLTRGLTFPLQQYAIEGTMGCNFEVIGNVWENPDLLEVGN